LGNQGIAWILELIKQLLTAFIGKKATYKKKHMDYERIDIANSKTCKITLLDVE